MLVHPTISQHAAGADPDGDQASRPRRKRYVLSGDLDLELWYDASDAWVGMRFTVADGSVISYERL